MPGFLLHVGAQVLCAHAGQAQPIAPNPRVTVSGQPVATIASQYAIVGCALPPPPGGNGPCVTAQFLTSATRVLASGQPILLLDSQAICVPTGTPLLVLGTQTRVAGT
jgi:hypothetical protein